MSDIDSSNAKPNVQAGSQPQPVIESALTRLVEQDRQSRSIVQQNVQDQIGRKEARRLKAKSESHQHVWFGLGMFGLVGWSVAIPTLLGAALGVWIDARWDGQQSWTLMLLFGGLFIGCLNAWRWLRDESEVR